MKLLFLYLIIINALALLIMLVDKQKARYGAWRIPEVTLISIAALGGSLGALFGMYAFRHKTRKPKFFIGLPVLLALQILLLCWLWAKL